MQLSDISEGTVVSQTQFNYLTACAFYQFTGWKSADVKIGFGADIFTELFDSSDPVNGHDLNLFLDWGIDNMDDSYFPHSGVQMNFGGAAHYFDAFFYEATVNFKLAIPCGQYVTLLPQLYNRWLFYSRDRGYPFFYGNRVGGYMAGRYGDWHMPFVGMNNVHSSDSKVDIARLDLRINLFRQHYLTLMGNYMFEWDMRKWELLSHQHHYGFAAAYGLNTIVGPIQLVAHWSNINRSFGMYFSLGYNF